MFRFTIRELVLLTSLVAVACGWTLDHARLAALNGQLANHRQMEQKIAKLRADEVNLKVIITPD